jgi:hypothetical protein
MKVASIVNTLITDVTPSMHKVRRKALNAMVSSLVSGADLTVTSLGLNISSLTTEKHQIKRSTRLCSNPHLQQELHPIYAALWHQIIARQKQPLILIDWSDLDTRKQHFLLRAAIAVKGRSLTLLDTIYPLSHKEKTWVHKAFLTRLKKILPEDCCPIVVTDASFRGPWFKLITSLDWDYIGRVRNRTYCKHQASNEWHPIKTLYVKSSNTAKALGHYQLCRTKPLDCQLVL